MTTIVQMARIEKRLGPVTALDQVDFDVEQGEVLSVNGAGKSTLVKTLSGLYTADAGTITIAGKQCVIGSPSDTIRQGVASVQQHPELVGDLSGYENIFLGQESASAGLFRRIDHSAMRRRTRALLERFPVDIDLDAPVGSLPGVECEIVAILHALKQDNVNVLMLDEPTSTLTRVEKVQPFEMMTLLKRTGVAIIHITHRLEEVFEIADRFTVFRGGQRIATLTAQEAEHDKGSIPRLMLQGEMGELFPARVVAPDAAEVRFEARAFSSPRAWAS